MVKRVKKEAVARIPGLVKKLGLLGITIEEAESLFDIMDVNGSGTVTPEEFIAGLQKIKGQAKGPWGLRGPYLKIKGFDIYGSAILSIWIIVIYR